MVKTDPKYCVVCGHSMMHHTKFRWCRICMKVCEKEHEEDDYPVFQ